jgi:DNA repair exonuclease SbcCD nuclease subunit
MPCVVINGNHDVHDDGSIYRRGVAAGRTRIEQQAVGSEVVFLEQPDGAAVHLFDGALGLWGKAMPIHDRSFRPLHDAPARPGEFDWWVVLGHGHHEPAETGAIPRSSPLTPDEIEATGADYVALGHWHVRTDVSTETVAAWYSGAPYGFAATEQFNLVDLNPVDGVTVGSVPVRLAPDGCQ